MEDVMNQGIILINAGSLVVQKLIAAFPQEIQHNALKLQHLKAAMRRKAVSGKNVKSIIISLHANQMDAHGMGLN